MQDRHIHGCTFALDCQLTLLQMLAFLLPGVHERNSLGLSSEACKARAETASFPDAPLGAGSKHLMQLSTKHTHSEGFVNQHTFMRARMRGTGVRCRLLSTAAAAGAIAGFGIWQGLPLLCGGKQVPNAVAEIGLPPTCTLSASCPVDLLIRGLAGAQSNQPAVSTWAASNRYGQFGNGCPQ
jgi:hypothetical protein